MGGNSADFLIGLDKNRKYICPLDSIERGPSVSRYVSKIVKENLKIIKSDNCKRYGTRNFACRIKNIDSNQDSTVFLSDLKNDQYKKYCDENEKDYELFRLDNPYERVDLDFLEENSEDSISLADLSENNIIESEEYLDLSLSQSSNLEDKETKETTENWHTPSDAYL